MTELQELQRQIDDLRSWASGLASMVQCLVEDRLEDENLSQKEKEHYLELLKAI